MEHSSASFCITAAIISHLTEQSRGLKLFMHPASKRGGGKQKEKDRNKEE